MTSEHTFADNVVLVINIPHKEDITDSHEYIQTVSGSEGDIQTR